MNIKEIKTKTEDQLQKLLAKSREQVRALRFKDTNKQLKNVKEIKMVKKTIAKILTVLNSNKK
jgi:ribosomal protein L29